ncbi:hypothetical protein SESBI_30290 [Sesbania bispinosa]|nr:hypothetical protein SESBI_30290 [Sesbania bispinosa]
MPPKNTKEMQQLIGKLGYIRRFIPALSELVGPMRKLLKGSDNYVWEKQHQEAFEKIKKVVAATHTMSPPVASVPLRLYLAATQNAINGLMAQEVGGIERPVAYLSRVFKDAEGRYTMQEKLCLGVIYAAPKYRHYFQGHTVHIISKSEGIKLMLNNNSIIGRHEENVSQEIRGDMPEVNTCQEKEKEWWDLKFDEEPSDWREPILSQFKQKIFGKTTKDYYELNGQLYRKSTDGLLMKCVIENEGGKKLECLHFAMCGQDGPSLYRRMQRVGMFWPSMKMHCEEIQRACPNCREGRESFEVNAIEGDWRHELKEYLSYGVTPESPLDAEKLKKKAERVTKHGSTKATPFSLVFGAEATLPAEVVVPSARMMLGRKEERGDVAELIEGLRDRASEEMLQHHRRLTLTYEKMVRPRMFQEGELV